MERCVAVALPHVKRLAVKKNFDNRVKNGISTAMNSLSSLMNLIDVYAAATGVADKTISYRVFRDSKKIRALRDGGDITTSRLDEALIWFSAHWPESAHWPDGIERPVTHHAGEAA